MCSYIAHISVIQIGATPLYMASQNGHTDVVDTLIRAGVSVNQACGVWRLLYNYSDCMWCELSFAVLRISCPQPSLAALVVCICRAFSFMYYYMCLLTFVQMYNTCSNYDFVCFVQRDRGWVVEGEIVPTSPSPTHRRMLMYL